MKLGSSTRVGLALPLLLSVLLAGCASTSPSGSNKWDNLAISLHGADPVVEAAIEFPNLDRLIDPDGLAEKNYRNRDVRPVTPWKDLQPSDQLDLHFIAFEKSSSSPQEKASRRDLVQERILAASERRCGRMRALLRREQADKNFGFGIATTITAGLGALVQSLRASQTYAGAASIISGSRAEYNDAYFSNLAVSVIMRGIEQRRMAAYDALRKQRTRNYANYNMAAAVKDAIHYDLLCNPVVGLEEANEALTKVNDPGVEAIKRSLLNSKIISHLGRGEYDQIKKLQKDLEDTPVDVSKTLSKRTAAGPGELSDQTSQVSSHDALAAIWRSANGVANEGDSALRAIKRAIPKFPDKVLIGEGAAAKAANAVLETNAAAKINGFVGVHRGIVDSCIASHGSKLVTEVTSKEVTLAVETGKQTPDPSKVATARADLAKAEADLTYFASRIDAFSISEIGTLGKYVDGIKSAMGAVKEPEKLEDAAALKPVQTAIGTLADPAAPPACSAQKAS
jgi:hypothetical protein